MTDDFGIWEVDEAEKTAHPLKTAGSAGTEALLEDILAQNPDMLMPGLKLVGRQTPIANGYLDLLGIDSAGRLVVFELKREKLRREAVAQAVDYASWLDSLDDTELQTLITENSGRGGIPEIGNFEEWYDNNENWDSLESLKPVRIVLVGLGADEPARRMADWLARKGVDIDLLTFLGFHHANQMLLARQLDHSDEHNPPTRIPRAQKSAIRLDAIDRKVEEYGMRDWWPDAVAILGYNSRLEYNANLGITFKPRKWRTLSTGVQAYASHKIEIVEPEPGVIRIVFLPAAVDLCLEEFEKLKQVTPFHLERNPHPPATDRVSEQWFCRLDESGWREHRESIARLVRLVDERWREAAEQPPS